MSLPAPGYIAPGTLAARETSQALVGRVAFLDVLRGIAALAVALSHALALVAFGPLVWVNAVADLGTFGVLVFFLCSGYIIPATLERHGSLRRFWLRRFWRLYPLYWVSVLLALICYGLGYSSLAGLDHLAAAINHRLIGTALANLTMLQEFLGYEHLINVYWTLSFELIFYLLVSCLYRLRMLRHTGLLTLALQATAISLQLLVVAGLLRLEQPTPLRNISLLAFFFVGASLYRLRNGQLSRPIGYGIVALSLLMVALTGTRAPREAAALLAGLVLFGLALLAPRRRYPSWLVYLGTISYSLYLLHPLVFVLTPQLPSPALTLLLWVGMLLASAALSERWIERPGIQLGYRLSADRASTRPAPTNP